MNPFGRPGDRVTAEHLNSLAGVREGWYIEYKVALPVPKAIAKSLSSFANTYGGWLCYGIAERVDGTRRTGFAGSFPGIAKGDVPSALQEITNAARMISPVPFFEYWVVEGNETTESQGGLPNGRAIILVSVSEGPDAPYIHASGRVYRRVADHSDPSEEVNRTVFDSLHSRSDKGRRRLADLISSRPDFSKGEAELPYLRLVFLSDRYADPKKTSQLTFADFRESARAQQAHGGFHDFPCDNFFTSATGYVARQIMGNRYEGALLTVMHDLNGTTTVLVPMRFIASTQSECFAFLGQVTAQFAESGIDLDLSRLLDLNHLVAVVMAGLRKHHRFCVRGGLTRPVLAKAMLYSVWRTVPFLDTAAFAAFAAANGPPVVQTKDVLAPSGLTPESLRELGKLEPDSDNTMTLDLMALPLLFDILQALGLSTDAFCRGIDGPVEGVSEADLADVFSAVSRATSASPLSTPARRIP